MPRLFGQGPEGETFEHLAHQVGALFPVVYQSAVLSVSVSSSSESSSASQRSS